MSTVPQVPEVLQRHLEHLVPWHQPALGQGPVLLPHSLAMSLSLVVHLYMVSPVLQELALAQYFEQELGLDELEMVELPEPTML